MRLNLGCGFDKREGYVNVDRNPACEPDQLLDFDAMPWPWPDSSADELLLKHVLEHLGADPGAYLGTIKEMWRILKPGGTATVTVPHPRHDHFINDPTHVRAITPAGLELFSQAKNREWIDKGLGNSPLGLETGIDFEIDSVSFVPDEPWRGRFQRGEIETAELTKAARMYNNVIVEATIVLRAVKPASGPDVTQGRAPSHGGTAARSVTSTPLLEFAATADFHFRQPNASAEAAQHGRGGERFFTTSEQFANRALAANPGQFRILSTRRQVRALARERWAHTYYAGKRVLFLLPSQALGSNVATLLFLQAFIERHAPGEIGVFCARAAVDIFRTSDAVTVYPLWIERRELASWNVVIDLGQLESRRDIEVWPVDMEADLLEAFELEPARRYGPDARPFVQGDGARIGILPLASSPLRTLPPAVTEALCAALAPRGAVTLCLNRNQHQGVLYRQVLAGRLADHVEIIDAFDSIAELLAAIESFDYAVLADSGPAHMTKLFGTPGVAVFTSAPGEVLQGRFTNLARWTVPFAGPHCRAPCGLAKLRQTVDGRVGCMGSLGVALDVLPEVPRRRDDALTERLLLAEPVPCVGALAADPTPLVDFVIADIDRRAGQGR